MAAKRYARGLVVGKFSPLHKGHEYLIKTAQEQCDEIVIISYSRPEFPGCHKTNRYRWLSESAPQATSLVIDAPTIEHWINKGHWHLPMPLNSATDTIHREFTLQLIQEKLKTCVDAVFTSEEYGEGFAQYLTKHGILNNTPVEHVNVDQNRATYPVSGSSIREGIHTNLISKSVTECFNKNSVCFIGGESTGKSTLSSALAKHWSDPVASEYGRTLWEEKNGELTQEDLFNIAKTQTHTEDTLAVESNQFIFCDTTPLTTLCYSQALFNTRPPILEAYAERNYHHTFLCEPDFPLFQDGTRRDEKFRQWQHNWYLAELKKRKTPFTLLKGSFKERFGVVCEMITPH